MTRVMVCGPFSTLMRAKDDGFYTFSGPIRQRIDSIHRLLENAGYEVMSAHRADRYGEASWIEDFVQRDLEWSAVCDVQLVLLPAGTDGPTIRSDGTMIELGFASALAKPIILLADDLANLSNSFFIRSFANKHVDACISWRENFESELLRCLADAAKPRRLNAHRQREQRTDVDRVIHDLRHEQLPHKVMVDDMPLTVLPGVLSPRLSHAPDALFSKWSIPAGARILDLGCGSGVLGLAALRQGAGHLVALDINPEAVRTTTVNLTDLGLDGRGEARLSDGYAALNSGEAFDVIIFAAPYWNRPAADDLERSCFDDDYRFFQAAIVEAHRWLKPNGKMYVLFSDQGEVGRALRIIDESHVRVEEMHLFRPSQPGGHVRIVWELRRRT